MDDGSVVVESVVHCIASWIEDCTIRLGLLSGAPE